VDIATPPTNASSTSKLTWPTPSHFPPFSAHNAVDTFLLFASPLVLLSGKTPLRLSRRFFSLNNPKASPDHSVEMTSVVEVHRYLLVALGATAVSIAIFC